MGERLTGKGKGEAPRAKLRKGRRSRWEARRSSEKSRGGGVNGRGGEEIRGGKGGGGSGLVGERERE